MTKVRVITAGRHGSTHEIGEAIAARLRERGHEAEALEAKRRTELEADEAVVLGSAIYVGRWLKAARRLGEQLAAEAGDRPIWLFSVGPVGEPPEPEPPEAQELAGDELVGRARGYAAFTGRLDRGRLGRLERAAANAQNAPGGDFRDWEAIDRWADGIATDLADAGTDG